MKPKYLGYEWCNAALWHHWSLCSSDQWVEPPTLIHPPNSVLSGAQLSVMTFHPLSKATLIKTALIMKKKKNYLKWYKSFLRNAYSNVPSADSEGVGISTATSHQGGSRGFAFTFWHRSCQTSLVVHQGEVVLACCKFRNIYTYSICKTLSKAVVQKCWEVSRTWSMIRVHD